MPQRAVAVIAVEALHDAESEEFEHWPEFLRSLERDFGDTCRRYVRSMFRSDAYPELVRRVAADMCSVSPDVAIPILRERPGYAVASAMAAVQVPIRCINSDAVETRVEVNRKYAPDYDAVIMQGVGHFPMLERPEEFNRRLARLLAEVAGG